MQKLSGDLKDKRCSSIAKDAKPLTPPAYEDVLRQELPGWHVVDEKLIREEFPFKNFKEALFFINKVGDIAEQENHHPDIFLHGWNKVTLTLSTHAIGGLSGNDFILAAKIDSLAQ